jgi:hypothetical protein
MKIHVEVDCTPDEARRFLGLPEVATMQERVMDTLERRMMEGIDAIDPKQLVEQWLPPGMRGIEQWQSLWTQMAQAAAGFPTQGKAKKG